MTETLNIKGLAEKYSSKESCGSGRDKRVVTYFCVVLYRVYVTTNGMNNHLVFLAKNCWS